MSRTLLMAVEESRRERSFGYDCEAEAIIVDTDDPRAIRIELADGRRIAFDPTELRVAVETRSREAA